MQFLTSPECKTYVKKLGHRYRELAADTNVRTLSKTAISYYQSRLPNAGVAATTIVEGLGGFSECLVWAHTLVWGDRSMEDNPPPDWLTYRQWRKAQGTISSLYEMPGHLFDHGEKAAIATVVEFAIHTGWDTLVLPVPARCAVHLSHDDRIVVHARARASVSGIVRGLTKLGFQLKT